AAAIVSSRNRQQEVAEDIVAYLVAKLPAGGHVKCVVNATVDAAAALLGLSGREAVVRAGHARGPVRIPVDLEGNVVSPEEQREDGGIGAPLGGGVRRVGRKGRSRGVEGGPGRVGLLVGIDCPGAQITNRRDRPPQRVIVLGGKGRLQAVALSHVHEREQAGG